MAAQCESRDMHMFSKNFGAFELNLSTFLDRLDLRYTFPRILAELGKVPGYGGVVLVLHTVCSQLTQCQVEYFADV